MIGAADIANCMSENGDFDDLAGITPRAVSELFRLLNERTAQVDFVVSEFVQYSMPFCMCCGTTGIWLMCCPYVGA